MDAAGNREAALSEYQNVMNRTDIFDSHKLAKKYMKKPYQP